VPDELTLLRQWTENDANPIHDNNGAEAKIEIHNDLDVNTMTMTGVCEIKSWEHIVSFE
jgi:hypothetical protein